MAFTPRVKIALLAASIVAFFLVVILVILPTVIVNRPETRAALQKRLGAMLGGEVAFEMVKLSLFPRVCVTVDHPRLDMPDKVSARAVELDVCLKFLPLLRGRVVADSIRVQAPEIHLPITPIDSAGSGPGLPDPRLLLAQMAGLVKQIPESSIEVDDGRIELAGPNERRFEFRNLNLRFQHEGERLEWSLEGESDVLKTFSSRGRLEADSLRGTFTLQATDFKPQPLQAFFLPDSAFHVLDTQVDLDVSVALEGPGRVTAEIAGKAPMLAFGYNRRETHLSIDRIASRLELSEKRLAVSISEFLARTPRAALELSFAIDEEAHPKIDIDLKGRSDLSGARDFTLAMLHEIPEALLVCDIVRSGDVPQIHVNLHGDSWEELADLNNLLIKGRLENGSVYIPWIDLDLNEVSGDVLIAGGILEGRELKGHYKGTRGENGTLRVGLSSADPVLQLDIFARAELSALPPLLARVVPDPEFRKEVALVQEFSGTAQGTLRLNGTHTDISVKVQAAELDVKTRYERIPFPLAFQGGEFAYDGDSITLRGVDVAIGNSKLFKHDLTLGLKGDLPLESSSPKAVIDLAELFNLFRDRPPFNHMRRLDGVFTFNNWQLKGQAFAPATWRLVSAGTMQGLAVESELLPGLLSLPSGNFEWRGQMLRYECTKGSIGRSEIKELVVEADWTGPPQVRLRALELDASIADISQVIQSFPKTATYAAAFYPLNGTARMRDVRYQAELLPEGLTLDRFEAVLKDSVISSAALDLPLTIASGEISWQGSKLELQIANASLGQSEIKNFSFSGDWGVDGGLELRADATVIECSEIFPRVLSLAGLESLREDVRSIQGTVALPEVNLKGAIRDPGRWRLRAAAELKDILITTTFLDEPIAIPMGRLTAADLETSGDIVTGLHIDSTRLSIGADAAVINGDIAFSPAETRLGLDVVAESLDWNEIEKISKRFAERRPGGDRPVRGRIGLRADHFMIDRFRNTPFYADATITPQGVDVLIERAGFCSMMLIGRISFDGPMVDAYIVPVVNGMTLDSVVTCLTAEKSRITGNFNLEGALQVHARREDIAKALKGRIAFVAEDGSILQSGFFAKLFSLLNLTEIYRGQFPDLRSQGLDYKRSTALLEIKDGKVLINDWSIEGLTLWMGSRGEIDIATQKIDFTIMVSPFKTIDRIINSIPGVRWILGGRLIAIPMKATGDLEDPDVVALSPSAIGTSILEMLQRMLMLPIEIIQPLVPGLEMQEGGTIVR
jgi:hypothetical protein